MQRVFELNFASSAADATIPFITQYRSMKGLIHIKARLPYNAGFKRLSLKAQTLWHQLRFG